MGLAAGSRLGSYDVIAALGAGGPASASGKALRKLRRGLAEAQMRPRP
jgi:hypothetical protein